LGIQANYIAQCIEEIKQELRIDNINVKCNAVAKLTYVSDKMFAFLLPLISIFVVVFKASNVRLRHIVGGLQHH
jgi:hypothetical protein